MSALIKKKIIFKYKDLEIKIDRMLGHEDRYTADYKCSRSS